MTGDPIYITHESPIGRSASNYIAMVNLEPFGFAETQEQLWLVPLPDSTHEISCLPFRAYGLAFKDTVELDATGRQVKSVIKKSGHRVFRVFLLSKLSDIDLSAVAEEIISACRASRLRYEWSGARHIAIDLPPEGRISEVWAVVERLTNDHLAVWEWADVEEFRS